MIKTARQLKDLIRNLSKEKVADAQLLMRNYMMEVVAAQKHAATVRMERIPGFYALYSRAF